MTTTPLSPSPRTRITRGRDRAVDDRAALHEFLDDALVAHIGVTVGEHPVVLPTAFAVDHEGPDRDGTLYVHGSVAAGWVRRSGGAMVCVTITELDGLVAGRSAFHHSMNYRSAVVIGEARLVTDPDERARALAMIVDHMIPGRSATLRPHTRKELAATAVLAVPLHDASMKARTGDPVDEPEDVEAGTWGGYIPLRRVSSAVVTAAESEGSPAPEHVVLRAKDLM
ncbi:MAG TPA: pyridoxamine 5'-phosphate oxidase family protein [Nocardioides sp.]|nr:pyridoxamine 5'-phosphate oxidase family protein [Nocardioides sp.]